MIVHSPTDEILSGISRQILLPPDVRSAEEIKTCFAQVSTGISRAVSIR